MYKYLFICTENIGRSQMAEAFYNNKYGGKFAVSAGILDSSAKYNGHPRGDVIQVMNEFGIDIKSQRIKQFTNQLLDSVEKILVLCDKELCPALIINRAKHYIHNCRRSSR